MFQRCLNELASNPRYDEPPLETRADGKTYCTRCGELRWLDLSEINPQLHLIVRPVCSCIKAQDDALRRRTERGNCERARADCFRDFSCMREATFAADDRQNTHGIREICLKYTEKFGVPDLRRTEWLILFGNVGVGKSFYAACVANALTDRGFRVKFTSIPRIEQQLSKTFDKAAVYDALNTYDLLILDDLGAERRTDYMDEIVFSLIEYRSQAMRPLLITSNLSRREFDAPGDTARQRVFSRLWNRCLAVRMEGEDRRRAFMNRTNEQRLRELLKNA
ncbi:MAG: ATP-binding protein [Oscillospiraceae bacterium]|nr:ATP-binding protein [Oscillospiraceae bacterium]